jgi:hypothetical protein
MFSFFNRDVRLIREFQFKYVVRLNVAGTVVDSPEREAIVKASSLDEAEKKLIKEIQSQTKTATLVTYPIKEIR